MRFNIFRLGSGDKVTIPVPVMDGFARRLFQNNRRAIRVPIRISTGSDISMITPAIEQALGLEPAGASGTFPYSPARLQPPVEVPFYRVDFVFGPGYPPFRDVPAIVVDLPCAVLAIWGALERWELSCGFRSRSIAIKP